MNFYNSYILKKYVIIPLVTALILQPSYVFAQNGLTLADVKKQKSEYYLMGYESAKKEYRGYGAIIIGFPTGILPFIGPFFIGAGVSSIVPIKVPEKYVSHMQPENQLDFESGYKQYVRSNRFKKVFISGMVCSVIIASIYLYTLSGLAGFE